MMTMRPALRPPMQSAMRPPLNPIKGGGDIIRSIFADGTDGFYFDFSKTDRLFQNRNNTPADDAGENIELGLESHAWSGATSFETILAAATDLAAAGGWTMNTPGGSATASESPTGQLNLTGDGTNSAQGDKSFTTVTGTVYVIDAEVETNDAIVRAGTAQGTTNVLTSRTMVVGNGSTGPLRRFFFLASSTTTWIRFNRQAAGLSVVKNIRIRALPGNHGLQATTSAQPKWQTGGLARFDGSDDNLLTTLVPGSAASLVFDVTVPATLAATQVICGGTVGTSRCVLAVNTSGQLCAGVGTDATTTIVGSTDLRSSRAKVGLVFNGSLVKLFENAAEVYSAAQNGSAGSDALRLGASNNGGTAGSFWAGDTYKALAIKKALTAAQITAITNLWGTS